MVPHKSPRSQLYIMGLIIVWDVNSLRRVNACQRRSIGNNADKDDRGSGKRLCKVSPISRWNPGRNSLTIQLQLGIPGPTLSRESSAVWRRPRETLSPKAAEKEANRASPSVMQISVWPIITGVFAGTTAIATATRPDLQPPVTSFPSFR